ncbi:hypothetical protein [Cytobacillus oceanisediminis]|uniref:Uncharacterized protein n=1 Tax=Cytobacillus oceanisediminis TaxID=665099 RepID=A0ABX3CLS0_9BACI|nr:hypothetical protein [Cytobacillus oceanisediminis]OHX42893.1 hypothetical protein BBV17_26610 [Cytobacillus oceanisediminis]
MKYEIAPAYQGRKEISAEDLLTAVHISLNQEADLFEDGKLICSWLGLPMDQNIENLHRKGITTYVQSHQYSFKWTDENKNSNKIFAMFLSHVWEGEDMLQVNVHHYRASINEREFNNLDELHQFLFRNYPDIMPSFISVWVFGGESKNYRLNSVSPEGATVLAGGDSF